MAKLILNVEIEVSIEELNKYKDYLFKEVRSNKSVQMRSIPFFKDIEDRDFNITHVEYDSDNRPLGLGSLREHIINDQLASLKVMALV